MDMEVFCRIRYNKKNDGESAIFSEKLFANIVVNRYAIANALNPSGVI